MLRKHSISIRGHQTSFSLEDAFYVELKRIAETKKLPLARLITELDEKRLPTENLSSTLRVFVLNEVLGEKTKHG